MGETPQEELIARAFRGFFIPERRALASVVWGVVGEQLADNGRLASMITQVADEIQAGTCVVRGSVPAPAPDLVFDTGGRVRAVIEWKNGRQGANANVTSRATFEALGSRADGASLEYLRQADAVPAERALFAYGAAGALVPGMSQLDVYYLGQWERTAGLVIDSPEDVLWLFMDLDGRTPDDAFEGNAVTSARWHSIDVSRLLVRLDQAAARNQLSRDEQDAVTLFTGLLFLFARDRGLTQASIPSEWIDELSARAA